MSRAKRNIKTTTDVIAATSEEEPPPSVLFLVLTLSMLVGCGHGETGKLNVILINYVKVIITFMTGYMCSQIWILKFSGMHYKLCVYM